MKSAATRPLPPQTPAARARSAADVHRLLVDLPTVRARRGRRITTVVVALLVVAATYVILAMTLVVVSQPINGTLYLINRVGVTGGAAPAGVTLLMDLDHNGATWSRRWTSTTWRIHRPIVVDVLAAPTPITIVVENGQTIAHTMPQPHDGHADTDTYLVACRAGACTPGTILIVPAANTIGTVEAAISF